jgi:4-hydroxybenzoate polyprenyltransferase
MMIRPPVALLLLLFAAIGVAQAGLANALHPLFTVVPLVLAGWFVHATVVNDLGDEAIDRVNLDDARGRPLVSGLATRADLRRLGRIAAVVAVAFGFAVSWRVGLVVAVGLVLNLAYSVRPVRLCDRGAVATALLPLGYVALPYLVGLLSVRPDIRGEDLILLAGLYVAFAGRILLKDFRDVRGDALFGKRTFLLRHGRTRTCVVSAVCSAVGSASLLVLFPWRSAVVGATAVFLACALHGLWRLATRADGFAAEQVTIGAIAQAGRGMGVALLAHVSVAQKGWPAAGRGLVMLAVVVVFTGLYTSTLAMRERAVVRPY